jgi:hypothetical protein
MRPQTRYHLVLAIYPQRGSFAFIAFESWPFPVDWGVHHLRGEDKASQCLRRISAIFEYHTPDVLVLQDMSGHGTRRAPHIRELNDLISKHAEMHGMLIRAYSRARVIECLRSYGAATKHALAETIANHVPALKLYVPPARKPYDNERGRMGIFDAAALAWTFFHTLDAALMDS